MCAPRRKRTRRSKHPSPPAWGPRGPIADGAALAPYKRFRQRRKPWRRGNSLAPSMRNHLQGPPRNPRFRGGLTSSWTSSILCAPRRKRTRRSNRLFPRPAKECGKPGGVVKTPPGFCISPLHTNHPPQAPGFFGGMAPAAARRARPVQRSSYQGLRGNHDACRPRRGSACDETNNGAPAEAQRSGFGGESFPAKRRQWRIKRAGKKERRDWRASLARESQCRDGSKGTVEGMSFAACGEANDLKLAPTTGGNARPVFAGQLQPTAALDPGSRARRPWWFSHRF